MAYLPFEGRVRGMSTCRVLMSNWYYHLQLIAPILFSVRHFFTHQPKLCETPRQPLRNSAVKQQNDTFFCETHGNQYFTTKGKTAKSLKKETHQRPKNQFIIYHLQLANILLLKILSLLYESG